MCRGLCAGITCHRLNVQIPDKDIHVVHHENVVYPAIAVAASVQGVVVVHVALDADEHVTDAQAISGHDFFIDRSIESAKKWTFEPNPEKAAIVVYDFRLEGWCSKAPGRPTQKSEFRAPNFVSITACSYPPRE